MSGNQKMGEMKLTMTEENSTQLWAGCPLVRFRAQHGVQTIRTRCPLVENPHEHLIETWVYAMV